MSAFLDVEVRVPLQGFNEDRLLISLIRSQKLFLKRERESESARSENYKVWSYIGELLRLDKDRSAISQLGSSG